MRGFLQIFQLILPLQRFDEGFLSQILRVGDVAHDPVNQQKNRRRFSDTNRVCCSDDSGTASYRVEPGASLIPGTSIDGTLVI